MNPVIFFFAVFSLMYMLPVFYIQIFGFAHGGVMEATSVTPEKLSLMSGFYLVTILAFLAGVGLAQLAYKAALRPCSKGAISGFEPHDFKKNRTEWQTLAFGLSLLALVVSKILLAKEGVYSSYAFDSGGMNSKTWTVSMGISEMLLVFLAYYLTKGNSLFAKLAFFAISLNLLHGTRIFTLIAMFMVFCQFVFVRKSIRFRSAILLAIAGGTLGTMAFFFVFAWRSGVELHLQNIDFEMLISPIIYESLFNQISFVRMLDHLSEGSLGFTPHKMLEDILVFRMPSILSDGFQYHLSSFGELSPLGGLSGYASVLIYFGKYYPIFYVSSGFILQGFYLWSQRSKRTFLKVFFLYIICSTFFRSFRDPWFVPGKMLIDNVIILIAFIGSLQFLRPLSLRWIYAPKFQKPERLQ